MNALITGGNGFVGAALARRLAERGDKVRCLVREGSDRSSLGPEVEIASGDITLPHTLKAAVQEMDVVFHLAGIRRSPAREDFFRVNAEGTRHLCDAMIQTNSGRTARLVLCGSLAATGPSTPDIPKKEGEGFAPREWYGESKAEAERIAFSYLNRLEVTVARPARILGPGDKENLVFFKLVKRGLKIELTGGHRPISLVDVEDVVSGLLLLAEKRAAVGEAFFLSSRETMTFEQIQQSVAECLARPVRTVRVPPLLLLALARVADGISTLRRKPLPLNRKLARQLLAPAWTCSIEKAQRMLGYEPAYRLADSIKRSAAWYQQRGWV